MLKKRNADNYPPTAGLTTAGHPVGVKTSAIEGGGSYYATGTAAAARTPAPMSNYLEGRQVTQEPALIRPTEAGGPRSTTPASENTVRAPARKTKPLEVPTTQPRGFTSKSSQNIVTTEGIDAVHSRTGLAGATAKVQPPSTHLPSIPHAASNDTRPSLESNAPVIDDSSEPIEKDDQETADRALTTKPDFKWPTFGFKKFYKRGSRGPEPPIAPESSVLKRTWNNLRREVKDVKTEDIKETDIVVALMGPTGAGKSSFISTAIGFDRGVGHGLESCTSEIGMVRVRVPDEDIEIVLVDTPGFDDTHKSDVEILRLISDWLKATCENKVLLSGILYLHRISDNRMAGTPLKNLTMFEKLCGPEACKHIIMVTTMWDELDSQEIGESREYELATTFWKQMIRKGSRTVRYQNDIESAWSILGQFLDGTGQQRELQLQREMVTLKRTLPSTHAGQELYKKIDEVVKKQNELMRILRRQMNRSGVEPEIVAALKEQCLRLEGERQNTLDELREMKVPIGKRLLNTLNEQTRYLMVF